MDNREWIAWGAGKKCQDYLSSNTEIRISFIVDNSWQKNATFFCGLNVVHPSRIRDWKQYRVLVTVADALGISQQLESYGLIKERDFRILDESIEENVSLQIIQDVIEEITLDKDEQEIEMIVRSKEEYEAIAERYKATIIYENNLDKIYSRLPHRAGIYRGFCAACEKEVMFQLDYFFEFAGKPAWRESAVCPYCRCNSRMRYVIDRTLRVPEIRKGKVYIYEKVTNTYKALSKQVELIGSEYLGDDKISGCYYDGVMHQDALNLSFESESMSLLISNDVFEHVSDSKKAFAEAYRVLKKGGKLLFTVPIFKLREKTEVCANICDGEVVHVKPPSYHGNPLSSEGSLVFSEYSWDILNMLREVGFEDAYFIVYFSSKRAYFGYLPMVIEAIK